jgi:predicted kinase
MQLVLFIGIQSSGKSTFYKQRFADTHLRLNLDMLKTRYREQLLFEACLTAKQPVVIDNTNPTVEERTRYITPAKAQGFSVVGYYFQSRLEDCKQRNAQRPEDKTVPLLGLLGTYGRLVLPTPQEGFDQLHYVRIDDAGEFVVEEWSDEVR